MNRVNAGSGHKNGNRLLFIAVVLIVILVMILFTCHQNKNKDQSNHEPTSAPPLTSADPGLPLIRKGDEIVRHLAYTLSYKEDYEQAEWVAYLSTAAKTNAVHVVRTNKFNADPDVATGSADNEDYEGSGYDRGHLAPAEDMGWSARTMAESFYYSNMSPQVPAFNRGVWKRLEELVRYWSQVYDSLYIVTGPVLTAGLPTIGPDKVAVPQYYYKVILEYSAGGVKAIGFVLPNHASSASLRSFAVSIDSVEKQTGIDFFPALPDELENRIEAEVDPEQWQWTRKKE